MDKDKAELSIVIPCLNEASTIDETISMARDAIEKSGMRGEVVVADNCSTDNSVLIADRRQALVVKVEEKGYGYALQKGIRSAAGQYIIIGDADGTYVFTEAIPFLEALKNGADLVLGNRGSGYIHHGAMPFLHRYFGTPLLSVLINFLFGTHITDVNCGLRAMTRKAFDQLQLVSGGMEFSSEMIIKAGIYGMRIVEFPCSLREGRRDRRPHLNTWRDGWRHLRLILLFAPHIVFALPGWTMLLFGLAVTALILPRSFHAFGFTMDYHYLFYSIPMIILGYQALWLEKFNKDYIRFSGYLSKEWYARNVNSKDRFPLEGWLVFGFIMFLAGTGILLGLFVKWAAVSFGTLSQFRLGLSGMVFLICGVQTIMNVLMVSMMRIRVHR
jgi:glycosyltransferase involved in cell wall biosynthesis